ncbi:MAG: fliW [Firmicutes bacterium]|nr:fliW [Bacillota bacterium]
MQIQSTRFGLLEVDEDQIISFPHGLPGFQGKRDFVFLPYQNESPFAYLQAVDEPNLTFVIVEPFTFFQDYSFTLEDSVLTELGLSDENPPKIFNIVRIPEIIKEMTANLLAPIIINWQTRIAMQFILEKSPYTVRHSLFPQDSPGQEEKGGK